MSCPASGSDKANRSAPLLFHFTLPDSFGYLEDRRLSRPSSKEAFGWYIAEKKPALVAILPQSHRRGHDLPSMQTMARPQERWQDDVERRPVAWREPNRA